MDGLLERNYHIDYSFGNKVRLMKEQLCDKSIRLIGTCGWLNLYPQSDHGVGMKCLWFGSGLGIKLTSIWILRYISYSLWSPIDKAR